MVLSAMQALRFLHTEVAEVADHTFAEGDMLHKLIVPLLGIPRW